MSAENFQTWSFLRSPGQGLVRCLFGVKEEEQRVALNPKLVSELEYNLFLLQVKGCVFY